MADVLGLLTLSLFFAAARIESAFLLSAEYDESSSVSLSLLFLGGVLNFEVLDSGIVRSDSPFARLGSFILGGSTILSCSRSLLMRALELALDRELYCGRLEGVATSASSSRMRGDEARAWSFARLPEELSPHLSRLGVSGERKLPVVSELEAIKEWRNGKRANREDG